MRLAARTGLGLTTFGVLGAVAALTAPSASAVVLGIAVMPSSSKSCVNTPFTVQVDVDPITSLIPVTLSVDGTQVDQKTPGILATSVTFTWTPATAGTHTLVGAQLLTSKQTTVTVDPCTPVTPPGGTGSATSLIPSGSAF
ncbi:hypothetical protein [Nocardia stercoris]|uniref:Ig-like domain repeat protein n=1 Tax=Nocardia stercoris TaxID=2483361 RepID=A0A3M2LAI5_9NOCA|nr:hypothetical protein [Nocardia stercoris]RMI32955.1 hypothetical protein EBN03_13700 [Nocardia stercoris]